MADYAELINDFFNDKGILSKLHTLDDGRKYLKINCENKKFTAIFNGSKGDYFSIRHKFMNVSFEKKGDIIVMCNELNSKYKFFKIYIDEDNDIMICFDIHLTKEDADKVAYESLMRMVAYIENNYEETTKAIYS